MRKLACWIIVTTLMMLAGWAEATTFIGDRPATNYSPKKVDCVVPGGSCPWGRTRVCRGAICWCAPCGGLWRLWHR
jgi:hypothetical protein